jgi:hypothetical protein
MLCCVCRSQHGNGLLVSEAQRVLERHPKLWDRAGGAWFGAVPSSRDGNVDAVVLRSSEKMHPQAGDGRLKSAIRLQ